MPLFLLLLLVGLALGYFLTISSPSLRFAGTQLQQPAQEPSGQQPIEISVVSQGGDDRYSRPPRPQRLWDNGPELPPRGGLLPPDGGRLINVRTQGLPESYQSMGLLKTEEGQLLPLYGRRTAIVPTATIITHELTPTTLFLCQLNTNAAIARMTLDAKNSLMAMKFL